MPDSQKTEDIKLGWFEIQVGGTFIPELSNDAVELTANGNVIKVTKASTGAATRKVFANGTIFKAKIKFNAEDKPLLARIFNQHYGKGLNLSDKDAGGIQLTGRPNKIIKPLPVKGWLHHYNDQGIYFGSDSANPYAFDMYQAFTESDLQWVFNTNEETSHEIEFEAIPDKTKPEDSPGYIGVGVAPTGQGAVNYVITNGGTGYTSAPSVVVGTQWEATTAYTLNQQVSANGNLYTATTAGTSGASAPTHTIGSVANGTATLLYAGKSASAVSVIDTGVVIAVDPVNEGSGYLSAPAVSFSGTGTGAAATAQLG